MMAIHTHRLDINTPHWRLIISLRSVTAVIAALTIASFAICISTPLVAVEERNASDVWEWGDIWIECFAFVPPAVSLLQTLVTIPYLLSTNNQIHPAIELTTELVLVLLTAFPIVFCATVSGPLQQWQSSNPQHNAVLAGATELVGFIGLCLLSVFHFALFVWACRRMHTRRTNQIARARAAALKLEAGWGMNEDEDTVIGADEIRDDVWQPRSEVERQVDDGMVAPSAEELRRMAREENAQTEAGWGKKTRRPSSISALSSRDADRKFSNGRRPSSLSLTTQAKRRVEANQIGMAIGKPHEIWVPITELRSESPFIPHRIIDDHEVVIVGDGEVKVVSTPREEVFMGFKMPEPSLGMGGMGRGSDKEVELEATVVRSPDPDMPKPLQVRKGAKSFKQGNSWEIPREVLKPPPPVVDQGW